MVKFIWPHISMRAQPGQPYTSDTVPAHVELEVNIFSNLSISNKMV